MPRSAIIWTRSRALNLKARYHLTHRMMISSSKCRPLNRFVPRSVPSSRQLSQDTEPFNSLHQNLPNLALLLRLEVHKGDEGDAPEYSSRRSATSHINRRCQWTGSLGIASCIRLRRSQGPDRDRWLSSFLLRVSRPTPPSRDRLISSVQRYIPSGIGLPSRSQIHLPLDSLPDPYLVRAAAYRKFAQCQSD